MQLCCNKIFLLTFAVNLSQLINLNSKSMNNYEVIIIGGSYSGLSAAMALGRAMRNVLIIDSSLPCNRNTPHSHNFITHDGETPAAIATKAREQVLAYPTVYLLKDKAITADKADNNYQVITENGKQFIARKLLFATGITDIMPAIEGFDDCWAISILHCPYCHGYEARNQNTAVLANGEAAYHYATLLSQWTKQLAIFTNGTADFKEEQRAKLEQHNINIIEDEIAQLQHTNGNLEAIILKNGSRHNFTVMYSRPAIKQHCDIPQHIGCSIDEHRLLTVDMLQKTTVPGVYAAGDCTTPLRSVAMAVASGMKAGAAINNEMAAENF
jgi:thioredoxin reductase